MGSSASTNRKTAATASNHSKYPVVGPNSIMGKKQHGTSAKAVQETLRWKVSQKKADQICNYNRHFAEPSGE